MGKHSWYLDPGTSRSNYTRTEQIVPDKRKSQDWQPRKTPANPRLAQRYHFPDLFSELPIFFGSSTHARSWIRRSPPRRTKPPPPFIAARKPDTFWRQATKNTHVATVKGADAGRYTYTIEPINWLIRGRESCRRHLNWWAHQEGALTCNAEEVRRGLRGKWKISLQSFLSCSHYSRHFTRMIDFTLNLGMKKNYRVGFRNRTSL